MEDGSGSHFRVFMLGRFSTECFGPVGDGDLNLDFFQLTEREKSRKPLVMPPTKWNGDQAVSAPALRVRDFCVIFMGYIPAFPIIPAKILPDKA